MFNTLTQVAEVFLTAGHAFQKLGDLTLRLNAPIAETSSEEAKWSERDVDRLKEALTQFAHELDNISESVRARTGYASYSLDSLVLKIIYTFLFCFWVV